MDTEADFSLYPLLLLTPASEGVVARDLAEHLAVAI